MKFYTLSYVLDHQTYVVRKKFRTRNEAIDYSFRQFPDNTQLLYEIVRDNKHDVEYVCSNFNRFFVSRCMA